MDQKAYEKARIDWITRQREIFEAQLILLRGGMRNPYEGAADYLIFADTHEAQRTLETWIDEIDTKLGLDAAQQS